MLIDLLCCVILFVASLFFYANFRTGTHLEIFLQNHMPFLYFGVDAVNYSEFLTDSFPSFAWVYVFTSAMYYLWKDKTFAEKLCWYFMPFILSIVWEGGQYFGIIGGYASADDVLASLMAVILVSVVHHQQVCKTA